MPTQAGETTCPPPWERGVLCSLDLCLAGVGVSCSLPSHRSQLGASLALVPRKLANRG